MAPTILSLCSGIGGIELGIRIACPGARVLAYVERDAYAATVLLARMEEAFLEPAPVWCGDITEFDTAPFVGAVDLLTAGFPCQPISRAGHRRGPEDTRWLWPAVGRIIREVGPSLIFLENVDTIISRGLDTVLGSLARLGYDAEWMLLPAACVGAPQRRRRWFCLAYTGGAGLEGDSEEPGSDSPGELFRLESGSGDLAAPHLWPPGRDPERFPEWEAIPKAFWPATEPGIRGVADGSSTWNDRLRCLGNAVVPLQAAVAFRILADRAGLWKARRCAWA